MLKLELAYAPFPLPKVPLYPLNAVLVGVGDGDEEVVGVGDGDEVGEVVVLASTRWLTVVVASKYIA